MGPTTSFSSTPDYVLDSTRLSRSSSLCTYSAESPRPPNSPRWLDFWRKSGVDFCQFHYYDSGESANTQGESPLNYAYEGLRLDRPCILGEFPTKGTRHKVTEFLSTMYNNGYAGALAWGYLNG